jgi:hypothetical protein
MIARLNMRFMIEYVIERPSLPRQLGFLMDLFQKEAIGLH